MIWLDDDSNKFEYLFGKKEKKFLKKYWKPYNIEYKIVKIEEETITEEELKLWHETKKYNL